MINRLRSHLPYLLTTGNHPHAGSSSTAHALLTRPSHGLNKPPTNMRLLIPPTLSPSLTQPPYQCGALPDGRFDLYQKGKPGLRSFELSVNR